MGAAAQPFHSEEGRRGPFPTFRPWRGARFPPFSRRVPRRYPTRIESAGKSAGHLEVATRGLTQGHPSLICGGHLADKIGVEAEELQKRTATGETPVSECRIPPASSSLPRLSRPGLRASVPDAGGERRQADRRDRPTSFWASLLGPRRRGGGRRSREGENSYVDRYRKSDLILLCAVFGLNVADAVFTLVWLGRGGAEGNPIMGWFLELGDWAFLAQKCLMVGLWLVILMVHKNFQIARTGLWCLLALYGAIFVYHIFLHTMAVPLPAAPL